MDFFNFILREGTEGGINLGESAKTVLDQFFDIGKIVFPVFFAVGAILIIIKLIFLGIKLAQSGDDPEMRSKIIKGMIWWGVGLLVTLAAIGATAAIFSIFTNKQS